MANWNRRGEIVSNISMPDSWHKWQSNYGDWHTINNPDEADGAIIALDHVRAECEEIGAEIPNYWSIYTRLSAVVEQSDPVEV